MSFLMYKSIKLNPATDKLITLGAGCYWGTEHMFRKHLSDKIIDCKVGFANGDDYLKDDASGISYKRVCKGDTDFAEVLQISYNPKTVSLNELLSFFFKIHDPTTVNSQGPDIGTQYRSAIFTSTDEDFKEAEKIKQEWQPKWGNNIKTIVEPLKNYYDAEDYHQLYLENNPEGYACPTHYIRDL